MSVDDVGAQAQGFCGFKDGPGEKNRVESAIRGISINEDDPHPTILEDSWFCWEQRGLGQEQGDAVSARGEAAAERINGMGRLRGCHDDVLRFCRTQAAGPIGIDGGLGNGRRRTEFWSREFLR